MSTAATNLFRSYSVQAVVAVAVIAYLTITTASFQGEGAIFSIVEGFVLLGVIALGVSLTMIAGELDLSAASMAAFGGVLSIRFASLGLVGDLVVTTLVCAAIGLLQGTLIAKLRINSLVFTIGTYILLQGAAWLASHEGPIQLANFSLSDSLITRWGVFSPASVIALAVFVLIGVFMARSRWGREIYATGGARVEAVAAGVNVNRALMIVFAVSGGCAGLAGALSSLKSASATPTAFGNMLLTSVAVALIGGVSLLGGRGTVINVGLGVIIVSTLTAGLGARGSADYVVDLSTGIVLVAIVSVQLFIGWVSVRRARTRKLKAVRLPARAAMAA